MRFVFSIQVFVLLTFLYNLARAEDIAIDCDSIQQAIYTAKEGEEKYALLLTQLQYCNTGDTKERLELTQACYDYAVQYGERVHFNLYWSTVQRNSDFGLLDKAIQVANAACDDFRQQGDTVSYLRMLNQLGKQYIILAEVETAIDYFKKHIDLSKELGDTVLLADGCLSMVWSYMKLDKPQMALQYVNLIRELNTSFPIPSEIYSVALFYWAELMQNTQRTDSVRLLFVQAAQQLHWKDLSKAHCHWYFTIGRGAVSNLLFQKAYGQADSLCNEMLAAADSFRYDRDKGYFWCARSLVQMYSKQGVHAEAFLDSALLYAHKTKLAWDLEYIYKVQAGYYKYHKQWERAFLALEKYKQYADTMQKIRKEDYWENQRRSFLEKERNQQFENTRLKLKNARLFLLVIGIIVMAIIALAIFFYLQFRLKAQRRMAIVQKENAQIAQKALLQQMNPHFIFNTLNSIQYYMFRNDKEATNEYLSNFSSLIRKVLENSQHSFVPIEDELKAVAFYLKLEQIRFADKFTYSIRVDDNVDTLMFKLPAMLIQPFVENSINHGIMHKEGKGNVEVRLTLSHDEQYLIIEVEDDGIGRKRAQAIKAGNGSNAISLGVHITSERISLINALIDGEVSVEYTDIETDGLALGTLVKLKMPIELNT